MLALLPPGGSAAHPLTAQYRFPMILYLLAEHATDFSVIIVFPLQANDDVVPRPPASILLVLF